MTPRWLLPLLIVILILVAFVLGLLIYLAVRFNQLTTRQERACPIIPGFPKCVPLTINGVTYQTRPFTKKNLYFSQVPGYLTYVRAGKYVYDPNAPTPGVWSYDGQYLTDNHGTAVGVVDGLLTQVQPGRPGSKWLFDGYTFYVVDSFMPGATTVEAMTGVSGPPNVGIVQFGQVPLDSIGAPNPNVAITVVAR